jgi:hypothetical protein
MSDRTDRGPLKLPRWRRWTVYGVSLGVWLSGAVWLIYHYFMRTEGRFGIQAHPAEVWLLRAHGIFSFWTVWIFGLLWSIHIVRGWKADWKRWSGGFITGFAFVLTITGLGLYYIGGQIWREWTSLIHWVLGLAAVVPFLIHWLSKAVPKRT